jgi:hypothetical protein
VGYITVVSQGKSVLILTHPREKGGSIGNTSLNEAILLTCSFEDLSFVDFETSRAIVHVAQIDQDVLHICRRGSFIDKYGSKDLVRWPVCATNTSVLYNLQ